MAKKYEYESSIFMCVCIKKVREFGKNRCICNKLKKSIVYIIYMIKSGVFFGCFFSFLKKQKPKMWGEKLGVKKRLREKETDKQTNVHIERQIEQNNKKIELEKWTKKMYIQYISNSYGYT